VEKAPNGRRRSTSKEHERKEAEEKERRRRRRRRAGWNLLRSREKVGYWLLRIRIDGWIN
jgi:hypothetical protein